MTYHRAFGALLLLLIVGATACGSDDASINASTGGDVEITMIDNAFEPTALDVKLGDEITFRFRNDGELDHDAIIGTDDDQADHEQEMNGERAAGEDHGTAMGHEADKDTDAITVPPGKTGELTYRFEKAGTILIGCHEPGHYKAGMKATITVS